MVKSSDVEEEKKADRYIIGMRLPATAAGLHSHVTLAYLGEAHPDNLRQAKIDVFAIPHAVAIKFGEYDTFGSSEAIASGKGIRVRKCSIVDSDLAAQLVSLHEDWAVVDDITGIKLSVPNYHVSERTIGVEELKALDVVICREFFIKVVGREDVIFFNRVQPPVPIMRLDIAFGTTDVSSVTTIGAPIPVSLLIPPGVSTFEVTACGRGGDGTELGPGTDGERKSITLPLSAGSSSYSIILGGGATALVKDGITLVSAAAAKPGPSPT